MVGKGDRNGGTTGFDGSEIRMEECDELQCKPGWQGNPYACEDVDECFDNLHEVFMNFQALTISFNNFSVI